jgi:hypothetical protein
MMLSTCIMNLLDTYISSLERCVFNAFAHFIIILLLLLVC